MPTIKISKSSIDKVRAADRDVLYWDVQMKGFGLKVTPKGKKTYICQYRVIGQKNAKRFTIGTHGIFTPDQARIEARKLLGLVANGQDPAEDKNLKKKELTVAQLCEQYLREGCSTKKPSTILTDRGRITRHIIPLLGKKKVPDISRNDIKKFLRDIADGKTSTDVKTGKFGRAIVTGGKGTASRTVGLLGGILSFAVDIGLIESNPVHGVKKFSDKRCDRFLSEQELLSLGKALRKAASEGANPNSIAILRLLIFTGARKGEIESLKWHEVDFERGSLRLDDSKTGQKIIPLNAGALQTLAMLPKFEGIDYVFPAANGQGYFVGTPKIWRKIRTIAGLTDMRMHDLRHSFASIAVSAGTSLPIIGALLGHRDSTTTQRYAHLSDDPLRNASELVDRRIKDAFGEMLEIS